MARRYALGRVVSVDPHTAPSATDPHLRGTVSSYDDFALNLAAAGLWEQVAVHKAFSRQLAAKWDRSIRLLWIDGDHAYAGAREDFNLFSPHLADGAIVALHDALHEFEGPVRVLTERCLPVTPSVLPASAAPSAGPSTDRATAAVSAVRASRWRAASPVWFHSYGRESPAAGGSWSTSFFARWSPTARWIPRSGLRAFPKDERRVRRAPGGGR